MDLIEERDGDSAIDASKPLVAAVSRPPENQAILLSVEDS